MQFYFKNTDNLDDVFRGAFIEQEQQETKSKQIEERIKSQEWSLTFSIGSIICFLFLI